MYVPTLPDKCFCAAPFGVGVRLRSPSISQFPPYLDEFKKFITQSIHLYPYQLHIDSISWESGPRLRMFLLFFPEHNKSILFEASEIRTIAAVFAGFTIPGSDVFGPYDLLNFTAKGPYSNSEYCICLSVIFHGMKSALELTNFWIYSSAALHKQRWWWWSEQRCSGRNSAGVNLFCRSVSCHHRAFLTKTTTRVLDQSCQGSIMLVVI